MVSYGDEVDVLDMGICRILKENEQDKNIKGTFWVFLCCETDGSINWFVNPDREDTELLHRRAKFVRER